MPSWLTLLLFVLACIGLVGLQAAALTGSWRGFWTACRQYGAYMAVMAALGLLVWWSLSIWTPVP